MLYFLVSYCLFHLNAMLETATPVLNSSPTFKCFHSKFRLRTATIEALLKHLIQKVWMSNDALTFYTFNLATVKYSFKVF